MATTTTYKTLSDIINREDRYDLRNIAYYTTTIDGGLIIPDTTLFDTYIRYVWQYTQLFEVNKAQREYYRYRPQLLSLDIYGTPSLAWLILKLNDGECASHFTLKSRLRLIDRETLASIYDTLVARASSTIEQNHARFNALIGTEV